MERDEFISRILAIQDKLYHISYSLLPNPHDQDDAVQECMHKAIRKHETLREDAYLETWLIRILINECYTILRKKKKEQPTEAIPIVVPETANEALFDAIIQIVPKLRILIVLHYIEGYSTKEIAKMQRLPEGTVKSRMARARAQLRSLLAEEVPE